MRLRSIRLENISGFRTSSIDLQSDLLLIGENNSGKTSVLKILNWVFNELDERLLNDQRPLSPDERHLLIPARDTSNRARRIFLRIDDIDGRSAKMFQVKDGVAEVRIQFRKERNYAKLGQTSRSEKAETDSNAQLLIKRLQESYSCLYMPAARDGRSELFGSVLGKVLSDALYSGMAYTGIGRPSTVQAAVTSAAETLNSNAEALAQSMWAEVRGLVQGGFSPKARFNAGISGDDLIALVANRLQTTFSTGDHDERAVNVEYLGAGLQSALAIALAQLTSASDLRRLFLLEEPEAFLHPSAQRTIAQQVLNRRDIQTIATTHSSAVLAEVPPSNVVVMRGHSSFPAVDVAPRQESVDRNQLSTVANEAMFDRSILLVEGPGDLAFFEALRRRMRSDIPTSVINRMRVCSTGSKTAFGPWLRLLRRYQNLSTGERAFNLLICADSIDAGPEVLRALSDSSITVPTAVGTAIRGLLGGVTSQNPSLVEIADIARRTETVNSIAAAEDVPIHFNIVDLEHSMLRGVSIERAKYLSAYLGLGELGLHDLMAQLGSKGGGRSPSAASGSKAPYRRALLGGALEWTEVSLDVKDLLWRWACGAVADGESLKRPKLLLQ